MSTYYRDMMESLEGSNMAMAIIPDTEVLPTVVGNAKLSGEERHANIHEDDINRLTNLAITQCIGETDANLEAVITHYVETINKYNLRNLGRFFMLDFSIFRYLI